MYPRTWNSIICIAILFNEGKRRIGAFLNPQNLTSISISIQLYKVHTYMWVVCLLLEGIFEKSQEKFGNFSVKFKVCVNKTQFCAWVKNFSKVWHCIATAQLSHHVLTMFGSVKKILKGSRDLIPSLSPSVKIPIMGGKVCLNCKGKIMLGNVNKLLKTKSLLTSPSNVMPDYSK